MRHTISVLVENEFGVLVARRRPVQRPRLQHREPVGRRDARPDRLAHHARHARATTGPRADHEAAEQARLVIRVTDFTDTEHVERELVLIKVTADERTRGELMNIVDIFRGKIIDVGPQSYIVEITGGRGQDRRDPDRAAERRSASSRSSAPAGSRCSAARARSTAERTTRRRERHEGLHGTGRDLARLQGQEDRGHRLRQPGPRARAQPARQRHRGRASGSAATARRGRRPRGAGLARAADRRGGRVGRRRHDARARRAGRRDLRRARSRPA